LQYLLNIGPRCCRYCSQQDRQRFRMERGDLGGILGMH
jgi:hypothetical protein